MCLKMGHLQWQQSLWTKGTEELPQIVTDLVEVFDINDEKKGSWYDLGCFLMWTEFMDSKQQEGSRKSFWRDFKQFFLSISIKTKLWKYHCCFNNTESDLFLFGSFLRAEQEQWFFSKRWLSKWNSNEGLFLSFK